IEVEDDRLPAQVRELHRLAGVALQLEIGCGLALLDHAGILATLTSMRRAFGDMNPTLRGFLVIGLIALLVVLLQLETTLPALFLLARIAFFLAIAYFIYLLWRDRREEISMWSQRSRAVFYGAALVMVV